MKNKIFEEEFLRALTDKVMREEASESAKETAAFGEEEISKASLAVLDRRLQRQLKKSRFRTVVGRIGRVAAMLVFALLLSGAMILSFSATARAAFTHWTHDVYENRIRYLFHGAPDKEYRLPLYEAGWLPEGVELVERQGDPLAYMYTNVYLNQDESIIILFGVGVVQEGSLLELTQMEDYEHETIQFEGRTIEDYFKGEKDRTTLWFEDDDRAVISMDCNLTREELLKFIKNLKRVN